MPRYIAFLRAINVGGHVVKMDRLRELFDELGFSKIETFIASGNVIFESRSKQEEVLRSKLEKGLEKTLGYKVGVFLRSDAEVSGIAQHQAFSPAEVNEAGNVVYVGFLGVTPGPEAKARLLAARSAIDDFHIHGREVYWLYRRNVGESRFYGAPLEKVLGMPATLRNSTTVRKLAAKYPGATV